MGTRGKVGRPSPGALAPLVVSARRLTGNPLIDRSTSPATAENVNGPSLIAAPPWLERLLGRYYLYFADHVGSYIRLATADRLEGPWSVYEPGTLDLAGSHVWSGAKAPHVASPDVHVDPATRTVRMYFHGPVKANTQSTRVAVSHDGISFEARREILGNAYFRVFQVGAHWYALDMPGYLYRSRSDDGLSRFVRGPLLFSERLRHGAVLVCGEELLVFWSRVGDTPERILCSRVPMGGKWRHWKAGPPQVVLEPEFPWEGSDEPLEPSVSGPAEKAVRQLRDPAVFEEDGRTYLLYSTAGEWGIGIAELTLGRVLADGCDRSA